MFWNMLLPLLLSLLSASARAASSPLDYKATPFKASVSTESVTDEATTYTVTFPSAVRSPFPVNDVVWGHFIVPKGPGPRACILVLPVMAAPNVWIEQRFMNRLVADGFAVLWLEMPYQFHRRTRPLVPSGQVFLARTAPRLAANFRQSVLDARRALWWLARRPEVDASRLGVFGVSLGAIVGSTVYSVDAAPKYGVFLLGGADFPTLAVASSLTGPWLKKMGFTPESVREAWRGIDPEDYKERNKGKPALLINARSDTVIPAENALRLRDAFPDARQVWVPFGHYTSILHLVWIPRYVSQAFQRQLGSPVKTR